MAVNSCEESQDASSISALPDKCTTNAQSESQLALLSLLVVTNPFESEICLDTPFNGQNYINVQMANSDAQSQCTVDIDIEKGGSEMAITSDETVEKLKTEGLLTRALQKQISLHMGEKFMQLLMNYTLMLPRFPSKERAHDTLGNRSRKYKRSASFNSRKVVLLFSVLSSMGTIVLIYLTLRVRQIGDGSIHA